MKNYCLKDICWIFTEDGSFVMPFIFNKDDTKIKDLETDEIHPLPETAQTAYDKVASVCAQILHINADDLTIKDFTRLVAENILQLKGIKHPKLKQIKNDLINDGHSSILCQIVVTEDDIKTLTREIIQFYRTRIDACSIHNKTINF